MKLKDLLEGEMPGDTQILALSVDSAEDLRKMVDRISNSEGSPPPFPFLTDTGHRVIDRYGLYNENDPRGRQITHPATYVIDKTGTVKWVFVEVDYRVRPSNEDILQAVAPLG